MRLTHIARAATKVVESAEPSTTDRGYLVDPLVLADLKAAIEKDPDQICAVDFYRTNADLIVAARQLGHLRDDWVTLDPTYDKGVFWRKWRPKTLIAADIKPRSGNVEQVDFQKMPWEDQSFDAVVLDPPYGLRGTVTPGLNGGYGLEAGYLSIDARHQMIRDGITEATRVLKWGGRLLLKCQDQVCSGQIWWQTRIFSDHAETLDLRLVERLDLLGGSRTQPERWRYNCRACGKPNCGPNHTCSKVDDWVNANHPMTPRLSGQWVGHVWLEQVPSPQAHAYERPSSLLIFTKKKGD